MINFIKYRYGYLTAQGENYLFNRIGSVDNLVILASDFDSPPTVGLGFLSKAASGKLQFTVTR